MRVESANPAFRALMEGFLKKVTQDEIDQTLARIFLDPPSNDIYDYGTNRLLEQVLLLHDQDNSTSLLARELLQIAHPYLWDALFAKQDTQANQNTELKRQLSVDFHSSSNNSPGLHIAFNNLNFLGHTLANYAAAINYGDAYPTYIKPGSKKSPNTHEESTRYTAGLLAAREFKTPAQNSEEVLNRLRILFPADPPTPQHIPAFRFAHQGGAFTEPFPPTRIGSCVGVETTHMLFSAYGKLLTNPNYQSNLLQKITPRKYNF